jgi:hypothetical protein
MEIKLYLIRFFEDTVIEMTLLLCGGWCDERKVEVLSPPTETT